MDAIVNIRKEDDLLEKHGCSLGCDYTVFKKGEIILVHVLKDLLVHELDGPGLKIGNFRHFRFLKRILIFCLLFFFFVTQH